ncbi:hypothetical protein [Actinoplanes sp. N902-109]|uniref:hypothetical protein n=1 Tax=Actinoplanes sp. (strain N902-109) TaxID=649831 RepID=UPI000329601A|nr:hypothetical protein [Actinoplanes sp. N902-109]AGL14860.1 hypothetical protein L083_1350 [Actinoplanes sp. N902-109]
MRKIRWVAVVAAAVGLAIAGMGAPAEAAVSGPHLITDWARAVPAHKATWIQLYWKTGKRVCNAEVTLSGANVDVVYPDNTETYSSFSKSSSLKAGKTDRTAINVTAHYDTTSVIPLKVKMKYDTCGKDAVKKTGTFTVNLPVIVEDVF